MEQDKQSIEDTSPDIILEAEPFQKISVKSPDVK